MSMNVSDSTIQVSPVIFDDPQFPAFLHFQHSR